MPAEIALPSALTLASDTHHVGRDTSHVGLLEMLTNELRFAGAPERALTPLVGLKIRALREQRKREMAAREAQKAAELSEDELCPGHPHILRSSASCLTRHEEPVRNIKRLATKREEPKEEDEPEWLRKYKEPA